MTITKKSLLPFCLTSIALVLTACGGGGSGGGNTPASSAAQVPSSAPASSKSVVASSSAASSADATPAQFSITASTDAPLSTAVISSPITLSGFDVAVPVSITNGEYSINGGAFTSAAGTISPAQTLAVKVMSSNTNSTPVDAVVTVGGISATYRVTTLADAIPNAFTFTPATNVAVGSTNTSNTITVEGIAVASPITITGGEYSIDGGVSFTSAASTVTKGQTVTVKAIAPTSSESTHNAVVTIGGISGTFAVTTLADTTAPIAEFKFPTPYTLSEATSLKVRGTATDDHAITSVKVVVNGAPGIEVTPKTSGDYSSWTAEVPLTANSENEIKVVATDDRNNQTAIDVANKVKIKQGVVDAPGFPDGINPFELSATGLIFDKHQSGERLLVANPYEHKIIATDLTTGLRSVFISVDQNCDVSAIATDVVEQRLYGVCENKLQEFNLADGSFIAEYDFSATAPNSFITGIAVDRSNGRAQVVMVENTYEYNVPLVGGAILAFSLADKTFSVLSAANQLPLIIGATSVTLDGDRYLITTGGNHSDANTHSVLVVDAVSGSHNVFSSNLVGTGDGFSGGGINNEAIKLNAGLIHKASSQLFVNENATRKLFSINLETGNRSVFTTFPMQRSTIFNEDFPSRNQHMAVEETNNILFVYEGGRRGIVVVDIETGEQVILTKSENDY